MDEDALHKWEEIRSSKVVEQVLNHIKKTAESGKEKFSKLLERNKKETCDWSKKSKLLLDQILSWVEDIDKVEDLLTYGEEKYFELELTFADRKVTFVPNEEARLIEIDSHIGVSFLIFDAKKEVWLLKNSGLEFNESSFFDMLCELFSI